jgi:O-acetyl-ADP-ribose deacetylase (regulator of RNase III)
MIHEVSGDILFSKAAAIAHGVAPQDDFKQGLALALRERWPAMYNDFRHHCKTAHPKPGGLWSWSGNAPLGGVTVRIVNLLTQEPPERAGVHPGEARLEWINESLRQLHKLIVDEKLPSVAITKLATGVGGMAWADVRPLLEKHLGKLGIPIYVYATYKKGVAADEAELVGRRA